MSAVPAQILTRARSCPPVAEGQTLTRGSKPAERSPSAVAALSGIAILARGADDHAEAIARLTQGGKQG